MQNPDMYAGAPASGGGDGQVNDPDHIRQAIDALQSAMQAEDDDQISAVIAKCVAELQKVVGSIVSDRQKVLGDQTLQRVLGRSG